MPSAAIYSQVTVEIVPDISYNFGHSTYTMDFFAFGPNGERDGVKSELEFPIDGPMAGLQFRIRSDAAVAHPWSITAAARMNVADPGGTMYDSDWAFDPSTGANTFLFSYTESGVEGSMIDASIDGRYQFTGNSSGALGGILSFTYVRLDQDVIGFTGWAYDQNLTRVEFSDGRLGITYLAWYATPQLGLYGQLPAFESGSIDLAVSTGPVWAKDIDDHVLRGKESIADGLGLGVNSSLAMRIPLPGRGASRPFVELGGYLRYYVVDGDQTQTWYQDEGDPSDEFYVPAGTTIDNLPHEFKTMQYGANVRLGLMLGGR